MTNLTTVPAEKPLVKEQITTGGPIVALVPQNIEQAFRLAQALAQSGDMIPKGFQSNPNAVMAAMMRGMEIGLAPMQALASIAVINGRASLWGDALPALMQRAGHHVDVEIEGDGDAMIATARLTRGDSGKVIERRFSMADAQRAGLLAKGGPWKSYPQRMVSMRARSWAIRDGAADALMGLAVSDEAADMGPDRARDVTPGARKGVRYREPEIDTIEEHQDAGDGAATEVLQRLSEEDEGRILAEIRAANAADDAAVGSEGDEDE